MNTQRHMELVSVFPRGLHFHTVPFVRTGLRFLAGANFAYINLNETYRLLLGLCEIMDPENLSSRLKEPNGWFAGQTPLVVVAHGKVDKVWELIYPAKAAGYL